MSTSIRGSWEYPSIGDVRISKKRKMAKDASRNRAGSSEYAAANANTVAAEPHEQGESMPYVAIDVDTLDDDVIVSSPMAFAQARKNPRRKRERAIIIDVESEERMRRRISSGQTIIDCDDYVCLKGPSWITDESVHRVQPPPPLSPHPPQEPTFSCPVCMGSIDEARTTKCGHIFCKSCLEAAITAQKKCPTCRARIATMKSIIKVYLPTTR